MEERTDILLRRGATGKTEQCLRATDMTSSFYNRYFGKSTGIKGPFLEVQASLDTNPMLHL